MNSKQMRNKCPKFYENNISLEILHWKDINTIPNKTAWIT